MGLFSENARAKNPILEAEDFNPWFMANKTAQYRHRVNDPEGPDQTGEVSWPGDHDIQKRKYRSGHVPNMRAVDIYMCGIDGYDLAQGVYLLTHAQKVLANPTLRMIKTILSGLVAGIFVILALGLGFYSFSLSLVNFLFFMTGIAGILIQLSRSDFSGSSSRGTHPALGFKFRAPPIEKEKKTPFQEFMSGVMVFGSIVGIILFALLFGWIVATVFVMGAISLFQNVLPNFPPLILAWFFGALLLIIEIFRAVRFTPLHDTIIFQHLEHFYNSTPAVHDYTMVYEQKDRPDFDLWWYRYHHHLVLGFLEKNRHSAPAGFDEMAYVSKLGLSREVLKWHEQNLLMSRNYSEPVAKKNR